MKAFHEFPPVYDAYSKILILGSFPSQKSRELGFYYMHPQNRFWRVLEEVFEEKIENKKEFLLKHNIALWDVLDSCDIVGSNDASIKNPVVNDIPKILEASNIKQIFTVGKTAEKYYQKYIYPITKRKSNVLLSTSPSNCRFSLTELKEDWKIVLKYTK